MPMSIHWFDGWTCRQGACQSIWALLIDWSAWLRQRSLAPTTDCAGAHFPPHDGQRVNLHHHTSLSFSELMDDAWR